MTNMQQIVEEIKKTKAIAEEKLEQDATYRVKYGRQVQAKERLRELCEFPRWYFAREPSGTQSAGCF